MKKFTNKEVYLLAKTFLIIVGAELVPCGNNVPTPAPTNPPKPQPAPRPTV